MTLFSKYYLLFTCIFSVILSSLYTEVSAYSPNTLYDNNPPIYHYDGKLAWNGDSHSPFYHINSQMAWRGPEHSKRDFYFATGLVCWSGYSFQDIFLNSTLATVYHSNGKKAWRGANKNELNFSFEPCTIFHNNGKLAWKGYLYQDCNFSYDPCSVYHANGVIAWKGATIEDEPLLRDYCIVYHSNGEIAWRGNFAKNYASVSSTALYYENGQIAWSGRYNDPFYDRNGFISAANVESIFLPIGDGSWLFVSSNGDRVLSLGIGDESYLMFSNVTNSPELSMRLGHGYNLIFSPYTKTNPRLVLYNNIYDINY